MNNFWAAVHRHGTPLVEEIPGEENFSFLTFLWHGNGQPADVVIFDGVAGFDAKDRMLHIEGTDVWYKTYRVRNDARFAYNLSPNDSLQSFDEVKGDQAMQDRLAMLRMDTSQPSPLPGHVWRPRCRVLLCRTARRQAPRLEFDPARNRKGQGGRKASSEPHAEGLQDRQGLYSTRFHKGRGTIPVVDRCSMATEMSCGFRSFSTYSSARQRSPRWLPL